MTKDARVVKASSDLSLRFEINSKKLKAQSCFRSICRDRTGFLHCFNQRIGFGTNGVIRIGGGVFHLAVTADDEGPGNWELPGRIAVVPGQIQTEAAIGVLEIIG